MSKPDRTPDALRRWADEIPTGIRKQLDPVTILSRCLAADELDAKAANATDHDVHLWLTKQRKLILHARPAGEVAAEIKEHHAKAAAATDREVQRFHTNAARQLHRDHPLPSAETLAKAVNLLRGSTTRADLVKAVVGRRISPEPGEFERYTSLAEDAVDPDLRAFYREKAEKARSLER